MHRTAAPRARRAQLELFPTPLHVASLPPATVAGARTRVTAVYRVRYGDERRAHQVFNDRHGWYCEEHGPRCEAVGDLRTSLRGERTT
jgi:ketosteroid isomerase-like protein